MKAKKIGFISLGCAKNRVNSEQMMWLLRQAGYEVSGKTYGADAVVVNTCGFIDSAKEEAVDTILELAALKKKGKIGAIIAAGCLAQRYKDDFLEELPEADAAVGTGSFDEIANAVKKVLEKDSTPEASSPPAYFGDINAPVSETKRIISTSKYWAYLKIAEGCSNCCAYCCIPSIRGSYRSRPPDAIINEANALAESGIREITLVAQDLTAYGMDICGRRSLAGLLRALREVPGLPWIRLLYMYPDGFDDELIDEISNNDKILKYLDIPIQHISDKILAGMNRRGSASEIRSLFIKLRERIPGIVFRTSIITGLPGEGMAEFDELCAFLRQMRIQRAGVFAYSPQEGTPAAKMRHPDKKTAEKRAKIIAGIQMQVMAEFNAGRIGTEAKVIIDSQKNKKILLARSYAEAPEADGCITVEKGNKPLPEQAFLDIRIKEAGNGQLSGEII